jgi:hypothetical protein
LIVYSNAGTRASWQPIAGAQSFNRSVAQKCGLWGLCGLTSPCYARKRERKEKKKEEYIGNEYDLTRITSLTSIFI